jgi:hypothetical protein
VQGDGRTQIDLDRGIVRWRQGGLGAQCGSALRGGAPDQRFVEFVLQRPEPRPAGYLAGQVHVLPFFVVARATILVPAVLAAYDWPQNTDRYPRLVRFVDYLFECFERLQK